MSVEDYIKINEERKAQIFAPYNPITGEGCDSCERLDFHVPDLGIEHYKIPFDCFEEKIISDLHAIGSARAYLKALGLRYTMANVELVRREYIKARCKHDFEFCAASYFYIKDKDPNKTKPILFRLNYAQRRFLKEILYYFDKQHQPIRGIVCKRRQGGFSTVIEMYFGWKQLFQMKIARSEIVAHVENTARICRGMYSLMISKLPAWLLGLDDNVKLKLTPYERGGKTLTVKEMGCRITIGSSEKPDNLAGDDVAMVHFSEVGLFKSTTNIKPEQLIQTINAGVSYSSNTAIIYESTARGVGNFFHKEYLAAKNKESIFKPFFSPWFEKEDDILEVDNYEKFISSFTEYEQWLFEKGARLESILWYRVNSKSMQDQWRWKSDQPTTDVEAFQSTGNRWYPQDDVERLRKGCRQPVFVGDICGKKTFGQDALEDIQFIETAGGPLKIWFKPDTEIDHQCSDRYVVVVDIGGASDRADNSVICVIDRYEMCNLGVPIVAAEWCGHIDHYLLAWKAVQLATVYDDALLVIESNTLESGQEAGASGEYILEEIANFYDNLYCRISAEMIKMGLPPRWGFHTNKQTKRTVCEHQKKVLHENMYIETCMEAANEHDYMEYKNGSINAVAGQHDDRHITRAVGLFICYDHMNPPRKVEQRSHYHDDSGDVIGLTSI